MLSTGAADENPQLGAINLSQVRVGILATRGIERCAIESVLARRGLTAVRPLDTPGTVDVVLIREGAGMRSRAVCERLTRAERASVRILTLCDTIAQITSTIGSGADGAILMTSAPATLVDAIKDVLAGKVVIPAEALTLLVSGAGRPPALDPLEVAVLGELAGGSTDAVIGSRCNLTNSVVRDIVGDLLRKFGARGRVEIVIEAHHFGLLL
jgi:DNA-binding NarL/FixJ family response regulator